MNQINQNNLKCAIIVGNGLSRTAVDLNQMKMIYGAPIFGCNALYRTNDVDFLIAFDQKIVSEIKGSTFDLKKLIIPSYNDQYESVECNPLRPRNNAGMVAMNEAIKRGYEHLICFGMDFALEDERLNVSNVFENTNAYGQETRASYRDTMNRCQYMEWFAKKNSSTIFWFMFPESYLKIDQRLNSENIFYRAIV